MCVTLTGYSTDLCQLKVGEEWRVEAIVEQLDILQHCSCLYKALVVVTYRLDGPGLY